MFSSNRKRKNGDPPPFPAWILVVIAIGLVVIIVLLFQPARQTVNSAVANPPQEDIELTATYIIKQATALAQGTPQSSTGNTLDAFEMTATYIVKQVTEQAGTPSS